jgi:hypothetical protein
MQEKKCISCCAVRGPEPDDCRCLLLCAACSERVLMIPHPRNGQSVSGVFANRTEWMLLDRSRISFDGGECDKVGNTRRQAVVLRLWVLQWCCFSHHVRLHSGHPGYMQLLIKQFDSAGKDCYIDKFTSDAT